MQRFAKDLVASQLDLILSSTTPTTAALLQQTRTIPIVFVIVADPVGSGFVASFPKPGGNVTGFVVSEGSLPGKWLELLKEIAPRVNRVAFLFNPATAAFAEFYLNPFKATAASFGVKAIVAPIQDTSQLESVVAAQAREPNGSLIVMPDSFTTAHRVQITSLAARYRLQSAPRNRGTGAKGGGYHAENVASVRLRADSAVHCSGGLYRGRPRHVRRCNAPLTSHPVTWKIATPRWPLVSVTEARS
jgi:putative ABC transport system substrate-binding protein